MSVESKPGAGVSCPELERQIHRFMRIRPRYERCARVLSDVLRQALERLAPLAIVQSRTKSVAGFAEKIYRKRKYRDPLQEITDLCGVRVIAQTSEEVEAVCRFIERHFDIDAHNTVDVSQRLKPTEFGYRSVHYVVQFRPGEFPADGVRVPVPAAVLPDRRASLKAEIQVRTLLEHAWADFGHDRSYKSAFRLPAKWERELATLAAMLEGIDKAFLSVHKGLLAFASSHGSYMTPEEMATEIGFLNCVVRHDPGNARIAHRLGRLAMALGDWKQAVQAMAPHESRHDAPLLRDLGVALCKLNRRRPASAAYRRGRRCLEEACRLTPDDGDALASLAGSWRGLDDRKAHALYRRAFEADPSDPYALGNFMEYEIATRRNADVVAALGPLIRSAVDRCRSQIAVAMNLPWAYFDLGKFCLLSGRTSEGLAAYAKAVELSTAAFMLERSGASLRTLRQGAPDVPGLCDAARLLDVGLAARFGKGPRTGRTAGGRTRPVLVLVAADDGAGAEPDLRPVATMLSAALASFRGTIVVAGAGPALTPLIVRLRRQRGIRLRVGPCRPGPAAGGDVVRLWESLLRSLPASSVRVLGVGGDVWAGLHLRVALALGVPVGVLARSGGEGARLTEDPDWRHARGLLPLPDDAWAVRHFVCDAGERWPDGVRETVARAIHEEYQREQVKDQLRQHLSMADWSELRADLRASNLHQADHVLAKLRAIGCGVRAVRGRPVTRMTFTADEIETMARMEHGRWTVERLLGGWRLGPRKDVEARISPFLVEWDALPEPAREWDRHTVRRIPDYLAGLGLEVRRLKG